MKKLVLTLLLIAPLLAGCAIVDTNVTINDDNSASVAASLTYDGNISDEEDLNAASIASNYGKFLDKDYDVKTAFQDKLSTITATKSVKNIKRKDLDLSSLGFVTKLPSKRFIEVKHNIFITSYNIDCTYDEKAVKNSLILAAKKKAEKEKPVLVPEYYQKYGIAEEMEPPADSEGDISANLDDATKQFVDESVEELDNQAKAQKPLPFKATFSVQVPAFASYNNADSAKGNVYTWNIKYDEPTVIKLQYVKYSGFSIGIVLIAGIGLLVLLARKIKIHDTQKRMDNNDNIV